MAFWKPIETAPKDGTVIRVRNPQMDHAVQAKWGVRRAPWGSNYDAFVLVKDEDTVLPLPPGELVIPTEWMPLPVSAG